MLVLLPPRPTVPPFPASLVKSGIPFAFTFPKFTSLSAISFLLISAANKSSFRSLAYPPPPDGDLLFCGFNPAPLCVLESNIGKQISAPRVLSNVLLLVLVFVDSEFARARRSRPARLVSNTPSSPQTGSVGRRFPLVVVTHHLCFQQKY